MQNAWIEGFEFGIDAAARRATSVVGGYFKNVTNIYIEKGQDTMRSVFVWLTNFARPTTTQLRGRRPYDIYATGRFDLKNFLDRKVDSLFSSDQIIVNLGELRGRMYYYEQSPYYVPFPSSVSQGYVDSAYLNKSNAQLKNEFGISFGGEIAPPDALQMPNIYGLTRLGT